MPSWPARSPGSSRWTEDDAPEALEPYSIYALRWTCGTGLGAAFRLVRQGS
ncbi:hypothetical protein [Arthrobacter sp. B1I2]|uniref:hypothetical protein n=1 Tax=Arthrobacter sp. B1I2 TaxID=3042263 RepID=UPI002787F098|nr:hypothetical protein [Arthrobacter sp. B1I2]MDQ0733185.1 hypothetical protein [Arthrobacter sp. B1I2]